MCQTLGVLAKSLRSKISIKLGKRVSQLDRELHQRLRPNLGKGIGPSTPSGPEFHLDLSSVHFYTTVGNIP